LSGSDYVAVIFSCLGVGIPSPLYQPSRQFL
jgi:hypothetical protein